MRTGVPAAGGGLIRPAASRPRSQDVRAGNLPVLVGGPAIVQARGMPGSDAVQRGDLIVAPGLDLGDERGRAALGAVLRVVLFASALAIEQFHRFRQPDTPSYNSPRFRRTHVGSLTDIAPASRRRAARSPTQHLSLHLDVTGRRRLSEVTDQAASLRSPRERFARSSSVAGSARAMVGADGVAGGTRSSPLRCRSSSRRGGALDEGGTFAVGRRWSTSPRASGQHGARTASGGEQSPRRLRTSVVDRGCSGGGQRCLLGDDKQLRRLPRSHDRRV